AVWLLALGFANLNPNLDNAGVEVRNIVLFYLMLCPCGAAWSLDRRFARWRNGLAGPVYVYPWPLRLLFVQLVLIYFCIALYKLGGKQWLEGTSVYYVLCDGTLTRFSYAQLPLPLWLTRPLSWAVLLWEVGFPLWVALRRTRILALGFGVAFHVGILVTLELG